MPDRFKDAVIEYLKPYESLFNYDTLLNDHLDISRFYPWVDQVSEYKKVEGCTVLSSGCASAGDLFVFMEAGAERAFGIEVNEDLATLARKRFLGTEFEDDVRIQVYDGKLLPYSNNCFDIVFSMHVIEHTQNPTLYLTELCRVLKPDGLVFLDLPNRYNKIEQHTLLPYFHFLPTRQRNIFIKFMLSEPFVSFLSEETKYKLETFVDVHFPSASELIRMYDAHRTTFHLSLQEAFYHSHTTERVSYKNYPGKYLVGRVRQMTTFRMIIRKVSN